MKKSSWRRGQAAVEFSLLLPFFAAVLFATIYIGMFVLDYVTLDNAAAEAARAAALNKDGNYIIPGADDTTTGGTVWSKAHRTELFFTWYKVDDTSPTSQLGYYGSDDSFVTTDSVEDAEYVRVRIKANWNKSGEHILTGILPEEGYTVQKVVRIEKP